ncbi:hypothetical protein PAAG_11669 [Paracoccidioides lutzii Pb01]|uniref:Uncharacterized protein n=1 Tax=Paracoccidioides lutzii (strain ATCC MYA-826 / Pb01) TaxID=502779 RepID=A0A0A2V225_PARBA|nr:hypothetical protein PAAG_11669 [Paracoccidioides lutzii Pb01]KGQ01548.1 hypothetical protein PAAG_11669 [Paracoccidioides lutzii Pb01]
MLDTNSRQELSFEPTMIPESWKLHGTRSDADRIMKISFMPLGSGRNMFHEGLKRLNGKGPRRQVARVHMQHHQPSSVI